MNLFHQKLFLNDLEIIDSKKMHGNWKNIQNLKNKKDKNIAFIPQPQSVGLEPTLPEGIWFLVRRLNHSATTATVTDWGNNKIYRE